MIYKVLNVIWKIIITIAVIIQLVCIGTLSRDLRQSETMVKAYDTKLIFDQLSNLRYLALSTNNKLKLTQKYLNAITKGEYKRYLEGQPIPVEDSYEE